MYLTRSLLFAIFILTHSFFTFIPDSHAKRNKSVKHGPVKTKTSIKSKPIDLPSFKKINESALELWSGIQAFQNTQYDQALKHFYKAQELSAVLNDYNRYWIGRTWDTKNDYKKALKSLIPGDSFTRSIDHQIFWEYIESLIGLKQWDKIDQTLSEQEVLLKKNKSELPKIKFYRAKSLLSQAKKDQANSILVDFLVHHPVSDCEPEIISLINPNNEIPPDFLTKKEWLQRAQSLINEGLPLKAIEIYQKLDPLEKWFKQEIALATFKARNYKEAATRYQELWDHPEYAQNRTQTLFNLANSYGRSNQFKQALIHHQKFINLYPHSNLAKISKHKIPFIYFDSGNYLVAKKLYRKLLPLLRGKEKEKTRWYWIWSSYLLGDYKNTFKVLEHLHQKEKNSTQKQIYAYWMARNLEKLGQNQKAQIIYKELSQSNNQDYYQRLALQRLQNKSLFMELTKASINQTPELASNNPDHTVFEQITENDSLIRAMALSHIGLLQNAFEESEASQLLNNQINAQYKAPLLLLAQNYTRLMMVGKSAIKLNNPPLKHEAWKMAYPRAYLNEVELSSKKYQVDPYLIWAIMRQESTFKPLVTSSAQAIGLMQIIPQTGYEIAQDLGHSSFTPYSLKDIETNIEYGTWYLKKLSAQFNNNIIYIMAAYNAGPDAIHRWIKSTKNVDMDEFIELIPYKETNAYVKKVLVNYWMYKKLYN